MERQLVLCERHLIELKKFRDYLRDYLRLASANNKEFVEIVSTDLPYYCVYCFNQERDLEVDLDKVELAELADLANC